MPTDNRPLSPHLQVYRWQWSNGYSIVHRATGVALAGGTLFLTWWLLALATGADSFALAQGFFDSVVGRLFLFGWTWSLFYHLANGIRHLFWDAGLGFELKTAAMTGHAVAASSVALTILTWAVGYALL